MQYWKVSSYVFCQNFTLRPCLLERQYHLPTMCVPAIRLAPTINYRYHILTVNSHDSDSRRPQIVAT